MTSDAERLWPRLEAIGYRVQPYELRSGKAGERFWGVYGYDIEDSFKHPTEADAKAACLAHSRSPEGMVLTMAAKVRWLSDLGIHTSIGPRVTGGGKTVTFCAQARFRRCDEHDGDSPEAAVNALFEAVPA